MERNYYYYLDKEGRIWHEGTEITDPRFALLVHKGMQKTSGGLLVRCQGENCFFEVEDVPYVVQDLAFRRDDSGELTRIDLIFSGGYTEVLDPATLSVSKENILYCRVRREAFPARFSRKSYFKLIPLIEEDLEKSGFFLQIQGASFAIEQSPRTES